jgi:hypothetical protein
MTERSVVLSLPDDVAAELESQAAAAGQPFELFIAEMLTHAAARDPGQAWFWSPDWQEGEARASADIAAGRVVRSDSDDDFLASLDAEIG